MKLIYPNEYSDLRSELNEFVILCKSQNYRPVKEDFNEVIKFLLLNHTAVGHMCESFESNPDSITNHLFESFTEDIESIDEYTAFKGDSEYDNKADFDTATGLVKTGAMVAGGAAIAGAATAGMYVVYLFKKGKIKKLVQKELDAEMNKLGQYKKLAAMRKKLGQLKGEAAAKTEFPGMASAPEMKDAPEKESK
jgi:hypothetical protein